MTLILFACVQMCGSGGFWSNTCCRMWEEDCDQICCSSIGPACSGI